MRDDYYNGIKEEDLANLCINITKYSDNISEIFSQIDDDIEQIKENYCSTSLDILLNSYYDFRKNYSIIISNINSYSDDLTELVNKMRSGMLDLEHLYDDYTKGIKAKTKAID